LTGACSQPKIGLFTHQFSSWLWHSIQPNHQKSITTIKTIKSFQIGQGSQISQISQIKPGR
jgi:hypothetical protein